MADGAGGSGNTAFIPPQRWPGIALPEVAVLSLVLGSIFAADGHPLPLTREFDDHGGWTVEPGVLSCFYQWLHTDRVAEGFELADRAGLVLGWGVLGEVVRSWIPVELAGG